MSEILANRHDILILFDVSNGNPNGDPDAGNMPRIDPTTNRGIITDVCLKRKVRNYVEIFPPNRENKDANAFNILVRQGAVLNNEIHTAESRVTEKDPKAEKEKLQKMTKDWLCHEFYDVSIMDPINWTGG